MKIKEIEAKNFRSYSNLKVSLENYHGLTLLSADNGSGKAQPYSERVMTPSGVTTMGQLKVGDYVYNRFGKSSIYFALLYALYGKCPDGTKADEVIKHGSKGGTFTRVSLEINGKDYEVTRYRKDKEYKNKVILTCNGEDVTLSTDKETNDKIIDILGFKEDTLLNSLVFSPEQLNTFINATDKTKKAMLEDLTNIAVYRKAYALVKEDLKEAQEGLSKAQEGQQHIIDLGNYQKALEEQWKQNKATLEGQKKKYLDYLSQTDQATLEKEVASQTYLVDHNKQALLTLNNQIDKLGINTTAPHLNEYNQARSLADRKYNVQKHTYNQLQEIFAQLKKVQNTPNAICSLCGNVLDAQHKQVEITNLTKQLQEGKQQYLSQKEEYNQAEDKAQQVKAIVNQEQASAKESLNKLNQLNSQKEKINAQMRQVTLALQQAQQRLSQYQEKQGEFIRLNQQVIEKPKELSTDYHSQMIEAQDKVNQAKNKIEKLNKLEAIYSDRGVKAQALNQVVPFLNDHLAKALDILTGGEIQASISSQTTTKTGKVNNKIDLSVNTPKAKKTYQELSSGEKRRVGISLNIAFMEYLQTQIGGVNLVVLDELFDNLDPSAIEAVVNLLSKISKDDMTVLVISHNPDLKYNDSFDNIININDNNGKLEL
uniref:putative mature peptide n=1 Tax=Lactobacillus phage LfeInf TaxID=1567484 RepID=UPI000764CF12|nr:putative mature peptide [Lactobacillus phage LfeInf]